jgi:hypothetical protein
MPMYYFNINETTGLLDDQGTELADSTEARGHARTVAREMMHQRDGMRGQKCRTGPCR